MLYCFFLLQNKKYRWYLNHLLPSVLLSEPVLLGTSGFGVNSFGPEFGQKLLFSISVMYLIYILYDNYIILFSFLDQIFSYNFYNILHTEAPPW